MLKRSAETQDLYRSDHYFYRAQRPLSALMFLLPFMALYEIGAVVVNTDPHTGVAEHVSARSFLERMLGSFSGGGAYLPGLALVVVLLCWHFARRDRFEFDWRLYLAMGAESVVLAIPLLMLGLVWSGEPAWALNTGQTVDTWQGALVIAIGAGLYEELLFRLLVITLLHLLLVDVIGVSQLQGWIVAVVCSALLFSSYHFTGNDRFVWPKFLFIAAAGLYLGVIFAVRGFGVTSGTHTLYDIYYVAITYGLAPSDPA